MAMKTITKLFLFFLFPVSCFSQQWMDVGGGVYNTQSLYGGGIGSMCAYNNELWCYGGFDVAGTTQSDARIAKWDGSTWQFVYPGLNDNGGGIEDFHIHLDGKLYVGGNFQNYGCWIGGNCISRWNGSTWENFAPNVNGATEDILALTTYKGKLFVGGEFNTIAGIATNNIACWDSIYGWQDVGGGVTGSCSHYVSSLITYKDELYVGGGFAYAGGKETSYIARWNGTEWNTVGKYGVDNGVFSMIVDTLRNLLYASGVNGADGIQGNGVAQWDGKHWSFIFPYFLMGGGYLCMYHNELYMSGFPPYVLPDGDTIFGVAKWNGKDWKSVGRLDAFADSTVGCRSRLIVYNDTLYAGAPTCLIANDSMPINNIARWYTLPDTSCDVLLNYFNKIWAQDTTYYCDTIKVDFDNNTSYANTWFWDFGDGETDTISEPVHIYDSAGTYNISLITSYKYCTDTAYKTVTVLPCDSLHPIIYGVADTLYMEQDYYGNWYVQPIFYSNTPNADFWWWDFGNGTQDSSNVFNYAGIYNVYLTQGTYIITLIVTNDCCIDTVYDTITVVKPTGINEINEVNDEYLGQNIPNPFDNNTTIPYYIPNGSAGYLQITDLKGRLINKFSLQQDKSTIVISLDYLKEGLYFYTIYIDGIKKSTKKMILR